MKKIRRFLLLLLVILLSIPTAGLCSSAALQRAHSYLDFTAFSREGLIEQLEFEGFSHEDAVAAADACGADWNEQAAKKAESYLSFMDMDRAQLIGQLEYNGFTSTQAAYGADAVGK